MKLILGLGNPGEQYTQTRHNAGFLVLDAIAKEMNTSFSDKPNLHADVAELNVDGEKLILAKPTTFMNKSGDALQALMNKYNISSENVWITYDDATLDLGVIRVRQEGSAGGHNGVKSIIGTIGSQTFWRFKIGVGNPPENIPLEDWVLAKFSSEQTAVMNKSIELTKKLVLNAIQNEPTEESITLE